MDLRPMKAPIHSRCFKRKNIRLATSFNDVSREQISAKNKHLIMIMNSGFYFFFIKIIINVERNRIHSLGTRMNILMTLKVK